MGHEEPAAGLQESRRNVMIKVQGRWFLRRKGWRPGKVPLVEAVGVGNHSGVQRDGNK